MKVYKLIQKIRVHRLNISFVLTLVTAWVLITYAIPKEVKMRYEFQKGKPWLHDDLFAPYDFPVYKLGEEYDRERDSVDRLYVPYFVANEKVQREEILALEKKFDTGLRAWKDSIGQARPDTAFPNADRKIRKMRLDLLQSLQFVYLKGVVPVSEVDDLPQFYNLVILRDNFADESDNESVFTQANAITYLNEVVLQLCDTYYDGDDEVLRFLSSLNVPGYVSESLVLDPHTTQQVKRSRLESVSLTKGMIQKGQLIVSRGEMVNDEKFHIVWSLKKEYSSHTTSLGLFWVILGQSVLVGFCLMVLFLFLANYKKHLLRKSKDLMLMLLLMVGSIWIARLSLIFDVFSVYLIPFVIVPILLKNFFDSRVALFNHILNILMLGLIVPNAFEFLFIQLIAGFVGVFHLNNFYKRGSLTATAALVFVMYVVSFTAYSLWQEGNIAKVNFSMYWWFGGNGLLVLISFPAIYIFERLFGYISDLTLIELSNANNPLLLELAEKAPGTFQHSLQVANLSESAAFAVGANPLLLRTGAMYHDIGKMAMPQYFVENQISNINPHDKISFEKSAEIIISHVTRGVEIAKKHNIPPVIIDFIRTHHGTSKAQYFYRMYQQQFPDRETNPEKFTYPGPKPSTRETAILMMADAVEAASRSLRDISEKSIGELIEKIISFQMREGQFEEADITFREIRIIKRIFLRKMLNIYHARIEYPEEKKA